MAVFTCDAYLIQLPAFVLQGLSQVIDEPSSLLEIHLRPESISGSKELF